MGAIRLLERWAPENVSDLVRERDDMLVLTMSIPYADETPQAYRLRVTSVRGAGIETLQASEDPALAVLPRWCAQRHIMDWGFCLGWPAPRTPIDESTARRWWSALQDFLVLQNRAKFTRDWPTEHAWPHGEAAAIAHARLEDLLSSLPSRIAEGIIGGQFQRAAAGKRLRDRRKMCVCGNQIRRCHEADILRALDFIEHRERMEQAYWLREASAGRGCCGQMDRCGLPQQPGATAETRPQ